MPSRRRPKGIRVESVEDLHSERSLEAARLLPVLLLVIVAVAVVVFIAVVLVKVVAVVLVA